MNLPALALRYRAVVITFVLMLLGWGGMSFFTMPRREDPEYTVRTCAVTTIWPGAPAQKVEELITDPLEEAINSIDEIDILRSTTTTGVSTIYVDAEDTVSPETIDNVWDKVRARVARVEMPESGITPDVNDEYGDTYVLLLGVYQIPLAGEKTIDEANRYTPRQLDIISEKIKDQLRLLDGVAKSEQYGVQEEAIYVETNMESWSQLALTSAKLGGLAEARNIVAPGGNLETSEGRYSVKPGGEFDAVSQMESLIVGMVRNKDLPRPVYLKDVGLTLKREYQDPPSLICRFGDAQSSQPAVIVALTMKSGANIVDVCNAAKKRVTDMQGFEQALPRDIGVRPVSDQSENVEAKIDQVVSNVVGAILIVVIVVYLVVGMRTAAVMAANIPVVVLAAIGLITLFDVQLEQISLASIIIALGLLVDNAVQVCDQSRTNQIAGMGPREATIVGSNQLAGPMLNGTATTVAAFFPMLIGLIGSKKEYVYSLPVTLSVTLGISWILAMTFCSILAASFIRPPADPNKPSSPLGWLLDKLQRMFARKSNKPDTGHPPQDLIGDIFRNTVRAALKAKFVTVGVAVALLFGVLMLPISSEFFPKDLRDQFAVEIWLPETASIEQTNAVALQVEEILRKLSPNADPQFDHKEKIRALRTMVGGGGSRWYLGWNPEPRKPNYAEILVRTTGAQFTSDLAKQVREICQQGDATLKIKPIVGARIIPQELFLGPSADPVTIRVIGDGFANMQVLQKNAARVKQMIRAQPGTWDVNDSWGVPGYQLRVEVDEEKANRAGVTNAHVANTLNAYFSGQRLTTFREGDHQIPVYLRLGHEERTTLDRIHTAYVEGINGKVPLASIATMLPRWEPATIDRRDLNRVIEVRAQVEPGIMGNDVVNTIMASDEMQQLEENLPDGFRIEVGGTLEESQESAEQMGACFSMSIVAIVLCLVIQYNGWVKPIIILSTLPMALIGALPGLYFTGNPLGFMSQLGILALFGIVLNTGIIFMEFADTRIKEAAEKSDGSGPIIGLTKDQFRNCLVDACYMRLLPIFLTTATTIGGLIPLALAGGPLWEGLAWAMITGLMVATVLTLLVIPAMYAVFVETFGLKPVRLEE